MPSISIKVILSSLATLTVGYGLAYPVPLLAQPTLAPASDPLALEDLEAAIGEFKGKPLALGQCPAQGAVITANTTCQNFQTVPSLWWAKEQFGEQILENWVAYPGSASSPLGSQRIDLLVNQQAWSLLDYLERYEFINHFGTVARDYGYNLRVFSRQGVRLAAYTCNFEVSSKPAAVPNCQILLDATGKDILRGRPRSRS